MGLSSRLFLLSADDKLHALASTSFVRMLRREDVARVPDFAGQRVHQASIVVEVWMAHRRTWCTGPSPFSTSMLTVYWMSSA